ncbi:MAG TPA: ABC transporter permease [Vicinamibacterales bacterium]|nr:ABC transporter permease [Vicinamibacterales bacterium]
MTGTTRPPALARRLIERALPAGVAEAVVGDLNELFARECAALGARRARQRYWRQALSFVWHFAMEGWRDQRRGDVMRIGMSWLDLKLGLRMLGKYPGLSIAGGLALAVAIGLGAAWYDLSGDIFRPTLPLPAGERIVEIEMRDPVGGGDERRLLHDFTVWREHARSFEDLGAYRTIERNLVLGDARPEPMTIAETTASAFRIAGVPPALGRPLADADERPGTPPVVVIGHGIWQRQFGGRADVVGQTVQLGRTVTTIVGVMPEGFTFPVNHRMWVPLQLRPSGYAPLEGPPIRVFARLAEGTTQVQAYAEVVALTARTAATSPRTHEHLRPRVLAYGGESPGDRSVLELAVTHLPIVLVLLVACANVGTLVYARTATREGEIALRHALGASRGRIVAQLFAESLVLATLAAIVGLAAANAALKVGVTAYYSGAPEGMPFWIDPGLKLTTVLYATVLTVVGAALLGVFPALKATGRRSQAQIRNMGGQSTLRFGGVWTTVMIAQVALTVICIPPALGISTEALRDRQIRDAFPAEEYLAVRLELDEGAAAAPDDTRDAVNRRLEATYREFERRVAQEPAVRAVTFADRLPGMGVAVRRAEVETAPDLPPVFVPNLWTSAVGPGFFQAFDVAILSGRDFHDGDRAAESRTVVVNEAFARRFFGGANPVGRRVRYAGGDGGTPQPWLEVVGMVRDVGMTPTDLGEAPYVFHPASAAATRPLVMAVRTETDPEALAARLRAIAAEVDLGLRLDDIRSLDAIAWQVDVPMVVSAVAIVGIVVLGLFLSAAGIFSLMSVSVARRTREIGLRAALGATATRLLAGILSRALVLTGSGVLAGNAILGLFIAIEPEIALADALGALLLTSVVMLAVGLLACLGPARRALRIAPLDALKEA